MISFRLRCQPTQWKYRDCGGRGATGVLHRRGKKAYKLPQIAYFNTCKFTQLLNILDNMDTKGV